MRSRVQRRPLPESVAKRLRKIGVADARGLLTFDHLTESRRRRLDDNLMFDLSLIRRAHHANDESYFILEAENSRRVREKEPHLRRRGPARFRLFDNSDLRCIPLPLGLADVLRRAGVVTDQGFVSLDGLSKQALTSISDDVICRLNNVDWDHYASRKSLFRVDAVWYRRGFAAARERHPVTGNPVVLAATRDSHPVPRNPVVKFILYCIIYVVFMALISVVWFTCDPGRYFPISTSPMNSRW